MKKYCTRCGKPFESIGREVICPSCKQAAAEESKRAAVERAKRASWSGESVPVRISGRASTLIRKHGEEHNMSFAESLDELLKSTSFFVNLGTEWSTIVPYKSRRRDKHATEDTNKPQEAQEVKPQAAKQTVDKPQGKPVKPVKTAAKKAVKTVAKTASKTVKAVADKAAGKAGKAGKKA